MADYYELEFLDVEASKSGDAIVLRYELNGATTVHIVDTGYQPTGPALVKHIRDYYQTEAVDHLVLTHCDYDHTGGAIHVLENLNVRRLWMLRPWLYAEELIDDFDVETITGLRRRLRQIYRPLVDIAEKAEELGIAISDPFQGAQIGAFKVLAPSKSRYLELILESEKTPETIEESVATLGDKVYSTVREALKKTVGFVIAAWNHEAFSTQPTSAENEMSVVQWATLCGHKILLTGDAGRGALAEAIEYAPRCGLALPGFLRAQVPHHGSRRNVSTELMDKLFGPRLPAQVEAGNETWSAYCSSALADEPHPRKAVRRAFMHRGARFIATESRTIRSSGGDAPKRDGWETINGDLYPTTQEE